MRTETLAAQKTRQLVVNILKYVLLLFASFVALVPLVSCVITAFKTNEEYASTNVMVLPQSWLNFDNFAEAWKQANMGSAFLNSFMILICVLVGSVMLPSMGCPPTTGSPGRRRRWNWPRSCSASWRRTAPMRAVIWRLSAGISGPSPTRSCRKTV